MQDAASTSCAWRIRLVPDGAPGGTFASAVRPRHRRPGAPRIKTSWAATAAPPRADRRYPSAGGLSGWRAVDDQTRRQYCYNSPVYRAFPSASSRRWRALQVQFQRRRLADRHEFNCHISECYSDSCRLSFRDWLRPSTARSTRSTTLGTPSGQWYDNWARSNRLPAPPITTPPRAGLQAFHLDSWPPTSTTRRASARIRPTTSHHNGFFKNIDTTDGRDLDLFAFDNYPASGQAQYPPEPVTMAALPRPLMIMEQQTARGRLLQRTPRRRNELWLSIHRPRATACCTSVRTAARSGGILAGVLEQDNVPAPATGVQAGGQPDRRSARRFSAPLVRHRGH